MAITYLSGQRIQGRSAYNQDTLGSSADGTNTNVVLDTTDKKLGTGCLDFNGTSAYVSVPAQANLVQGLSEWSVAFWINVDDWSIFSADHYPLAQWNTAVTDGAVWQVEPTTSKTLNVRIRTDLGSANMYTGGTALGDAETWNHIVFNFYDDGGQKAKMYVNGSADSTGEISIDNDMQPNADSSALIIGAKFQSASYGDYFEGKLDDIGFWSRKLTTDEITALWNGSSGALISTLTDTSGLRAYYNCDSATVDNNAVATDDKSTVTDVPVGSEFEQTDDYKSYQYGESLISGADLKAYIKFDDSEGSPINDAGNVTDDDSLGTPANITLTGTGTTLYEQTGTPSKLGNAMEFPATSSTSGVYGDFGTSVSQFNFLHGGTPTWTVAFWYKTSTAGGTNRVILRTAVGDTVAGITIYFYSDNLRVYMAKTGAGNNQPINSDDDGSDFPSFSSDGNWHFYVITMDFNLASQTLKMSKDDGTRTTADKSANAPSSISTDSGNALAFRHTAGGATDIAPTAQMAELSIWNRVLTDAEITTLYNSGSGFQLDTGLKVWVERGTAI